MADLTSQNSLPPGGLLMPAKLVVALAILAISSPCYAASLISAGKPVIGGSGSYPNIAFNAGSYAATNVTNGPPDAVENVGEYWLGVDGANNQYFVLDLQNIFKIDHFDIFNTHNDGSNDRGTQNYSISYSQDNVSFTSVGSGVLPNITTDPVPAVTLNGNGVIARYIRFDAITRYGLSTGLNELQVFGDVVLPLTPEPASVALMAGALGLLGLFAWRQRRMLTS